MLKAWQTFCGKCRKQFWWLGSFQRQRQRHRQGQGRCPWSKYPFLSARRPQMLVSATLFPRTLFSRADRPVYVGPAWADCAHYQLSPIKRSLALACQARKSR